MLNTRCCQNFQVHPAPVRVRIHAVLYGVDHGDVVLGKPVLLCPSQYKGLVPIPWGQTIAMLGGIIGKAVDNTVFTVHPYRPVDVTMPHAFDPVQNRLFVHVHAVQHPKNVMIFRHWFNTAFARSVASGLVEMQAVTVEPRNTYALN